MTNFKQIVTDFLNNNRRQAEELMFSSYPKTWDKFDDLPFEHQELDHHGGEGEGSDYWTVIEIRDPDNHDETYMIKLQGWYASYNGAEYESWSFVQPKQKTITVYE